MEPKLCECGCGQPAPIAKKTCRTSGRVKGQPMHYVSGHNAGQGHENDPIVRAQTEQNNRKRYRLEQRCRLKLHVKTYLETHPCIDCGVSDFRVLDFDHRDPSEKYRSIADIVHLCLGINKLKEEIEKCDIRCSNCHRIRHYEENQKER